MKGQKTHLEDAYIAVRDRLRNHVSPERDRLIDIAAMLVDCTLLWYPIREHERGERVIAKLTYRIGNDNTLKWSKRVARSLAWKQYPELVPLIHVGADANFHLEIEAPSVLRIREPIQPRFWWLTSPPDRGVATATSVDDAAARAGVRPERHSDTNGRYAHLYVSSRRPMTADVTFTFAPVRGGFVLTAFVAALLIALLTTVLYIDRMQLIRDPHLDGAVGILLLVPALIGYVAVRPSDPPLVRRYHVGVQILVLLAAAAPVVMAIILMITTDRGNGLRGGWRVCMVGSWAFAVGLLGSLIGSTRSQK